MGKKNFQRTFFCLNSFRLCTHLIIHKWISNFATTIYNYICNQFYSILLIKTEKLYSPGTWRFPHFLTLNNMRLLAAFLLLSHFQSDFVYARWNPKYVHWNARKTAKYAQQFARKIGKLSKNTKALWKIGNQKKEKIAKIEQANFVFCLMPIW